MRCWEESVLLTAAMMLASSMSAQQPGDLDSSFNNVGIVITDLGSPYEFASSVALQPDGRIVVAGQSGNTGTGDADFALVRYNVDGSLDGSFGSGGQIVTDFAGDNDKPNGLAVQPDGRIVAAGFAVMPSTSHDFALARYNPDGTLDSTFDLDGKLTIALAVGIDQVWAMALQDDGKIVVAGKTQVGVSDADFALVRLLPNGALDTSFSTDGEVTTSFSTNNDIGVAMAIQPDGRIVVAGETFLQPTYIDIALARYNADGTLDSTFGFGGTLTTDFFMEEDVSRGVAIQPDGRVVVVGYAVNDTVPSYWALVRYNTDGTPDNSFGIGGKVTTDFGPYYDEANAVIIQPDGRIIAVGRGVSGFGLARYNSDGSLDTSFGLGGKVVTADTNFSMGAMDAVMQPDGRIVAAGSSSSWATGEGNFCVARYLTDLNLGAIQFNQYNQKAFVFPNPIQSSAHLQYVLQYTETITIELSDVQGRPLVTYVDGEYQFAGEHEQEISLPASLPSGSYLLVISSSSGRVTVQLMK